MRFPALVVSVLSGVFLLAGAATPAFAVTSDPATINVTWNDSDDAAGMRATFDIDVQAVVDGETRTVDTIIASTQDATYTAGGGIVVDSYKLNVHGASGYIATVAADGATSFDVTSTITQTSVSCVDANGNPVPGARLEVRAASGATVRTVTSSEGATTVFGLVAGADYVVHVAEVPEGFEAPEDVEFTVSDSSARNSVTVTLNGAAPTFEPEAEVADPGTVVAGSSSNVQASASSAGQIPATGDEGTALDNILVFVAISFVAAAALIRPHAA